MRHSSTSADTGFIVEGLLRLRSANVEEIKTCNLCFSVICEDLGGARRKEWVRSSIGADFALYPV